MLGKSIASSALTPRARRSPPSIMRWKRNMPVRISTVRREVTLV